MKKLLLLLLCVPLIAIGQCIKGDCISRKGTYIYDNNDKYIGQWKNGKGMISYAKAIKQRGVFENRNL